ncbi:MAG: polyketide synthase dehydratase domain-containing protein, partial [Cyanobacteria bacterium J06598_3]
APLEVQEPPQAIRVCLRSQPGSDQFNFTVESEITGDLSSGSASTGWQTHALGEVTPLTASPAPQTSEDSKAFEASCNKDVKVFNQADAANAAEATESGSAVTKLDVFTFGPRWQTLQQVKIGEQQGLVTLQLPTVFNSDIDEYPLHPALLDGAMGALVSMYEGTYLPFEYKQLRYYAPLSTPLYSYIRAEEPATAKGNGSGEDAPSTLRFQVTLCDQHGNILVEVEDYALRRIDPSAAVSALKASAKAKRANAKSAKAKSFSL